MRRPRWLLVALAGMALVALSGLAVAQSPDATGEFPLLLELGVRFAGVLVGNLVVGVVVVALNPDYVTGRLREINDRPGESFGWGLIMAILVPVLLAILAATVIGLVVAIPGTIVLIVVSLVGQGVSAAWVGNALVGEPKGATVRDAAAGALALAIPGAIPLLGNLVTTLVGLFGLGAVGRGLYQDL